MHEGMKRVLSVLMALGTCVTMYAQEIISPDGHLRVNVGCDEGSAYYTVVLDQDTVLCRSALGVKTNMADMTQDLLLLSMSPVQSVTEQYTLPNAKRRDISYTANEATWVFANVDKRPLFAVTMHVDDHNVAFRYLVKAQRGRRSCLVESEATSYVMPVGTTTFLCPQMAPQSGFARTAPSYETFYDYDAPMGRNGWGRGYTFPALFRVTAQPGDRRAAFSPYVWVMLSETNVGGNYCASRIQSTGERSYAIAYPEEGELGGIGSCAPGLMLDGEGGYTPWRTITVGRTMQPIAETTIQWDLVRPQYEAKQEYRYGRSAWSWIIRMDASCNYDEQKEYVDFAAAMGWEYLLVDALWDTRIGYDRIEKLSRYAQSRGVSLFLWYNSNGYWNDAPQGPRGKMHRMIDRRREMAWMQQTGIRGIKVDFVGGDKQQAMQMYEDILADANDYGLMVIFHGCTLQRGWERMYPNFVACEAVRASENLAFGQHDNDIEALAATLHPVLRNAVGNMDFGGSALNKHYSKDNVHGNARRTSDVYALATAVLFQTPVQNFALAPNNLTDAPAWAIDFMRQVPVTWQDVRYIDGYPGRYVVMARQSEGRWYLAAVNAQEEPLLLSVNVDGLFQTGQQVSLYSDDAQLQGSVRMVKVPRSKTIKLTIPKDGGAVIM